jgi:hypothetical protein
MRRDWRDVEKEKEPTTEGGIFMLCGLTVGGGSFFMRRMWWNFRRRPGRFQRRGDVWVVLEGGLDIRVTPSYYAY